MSNCQGPLLLTRLSIIDEKVFSFVNNDVFCKKDLETFDINTVINYLPNLHLVNCFYSPYTYVSLEFTEKMQFTLISQFIYALLKYY